MNLYLFIIQTISRMPLMNNTLLYLVTILIWGSTWFAIEFQLGSTAPEVSVVYRYGLAALLLFAWCRVQRKQLRFPWRSHVWFALLGMFLFGLNYIAAYRAQLYISSALTAITFSSIVWMNILNARLFFGVVSGRRTLLGAALGVAGIATVFAPQITELSAADGVVIGTVFSLVGAFIASLGNMASQGAQRKGLPVVQSNAWGMFYGALFTGFVALGQGESFRIETSPSYLLSLAYLVVFGSIVAFGAYLTLLGRIGAHRAGYAVVMAPVVAVAISTAFEGLSIDTPTLIGMLLVISGNVCVLSQGRQAQGAALRSSRPAVPLASSGETAPRSGPALAENLLRAECAFGTASECD